MPCFAPLRLCVIFILLAGCKEQETQQVPADRLTVEYSIDHDTILVGDPVNLVITAYYPTNGTLEIPEIAPDREIVVLKREWAKIDRDDGLMQTETSYSLTSFRLGDHTVSTNVITCTVGDRTFSTNYPPVVLHVESALADDASSELADIKPVHKLPPRIPTWVWIVQGSALIAFLIGLITAKLWKKREQPTASPPPLPAHVIALNALRLLKTRGLLEKNECKPFYTELSLILRSYLEDRFLLNAPDETTEEIVEEMSRSPELSRENRNILQQFMHQADMVKFAKGHLDRMTMEAAFETAQHFIEETKLDPSDPTHQTDPS